MLLSSGEIVLDDSGMARSGEFYFNTTLQLRLVVSYAGFILTNLSGISKYKQWRLRGEYPRLVICQIVQYIYRRIDRRQGHLCNKAIFGGASSAAFMHHC